MAKTKEQLYTMKEFSELCGINRETLRFFERSGLLRPYQDPANGYRYYDFWDYYNVCEISRYRGWGYSFKEIWALMEKDDLCSIGSRMKRLEGQNEEQIRFLHCLTRYYQQIDSYIDQIPKYLNQPEIRQSDNFWYILNQNNERLHGIPDKLRDADKRKWIVSFMNGALYIGEKDWNQQSGRYSWGITVQEENLDEMRFDKSAWQHIAPQKCVFCVIDAGQRGIFSFDLFHSLIHFTRQKHLKPAGPLFGELFIRCHDQNGNYHRYINIWLPVKAA